MPRQTQTSPDAPPGAIANENRNGDLELLRGLTRATELAEQPSGQHGQVVAHLAHRLALKAGFGAGFAGGLLQAAALHDIGKIALPWEILLKPAPLLPDERRIVETHTTVGAAILRGYRLPAGALAHEIALHHHERWDGEGYPCRLAGEQIPLAARIVAIVDVCDALLSERCYKNGWLPSETLAWLHSQRGGAFDPALLDVFVADFAGMLELREEILTPDVGALDELMQRAEELAA